MVTFLGNALLGDNYHFYGAIITLGWPDWGMSGVSKISAVPHASLMPLFFTSTTRLYYHKAIIIHFYRKSYFTSFLTKRLQLRNWTWGNSWSGLLFCVCLSFLFVSFFVCLFAYLLVFLIACLLVCLFACLLVCLFVCLLVCWSGLQQADELLPSYQPFSFQEQRLSWSWNIKNYSNWDI